MNWNEYFFQLINVVATKSKDRSTKVGCVITTKDNVIVSTGFNGFCRGVNDNIEERYERPAKYMWTEHAERNALYAAARNGLKLEGCKIYINWLPCTDCARGIAQCGLSEVVINGNSEEYNNVELQKRWAENQEVSKQILSEAGVKLTVIKDIGMPPIPFIKFTDSHNCKGVNYA